jgi:hypothetical protein
MSFELLNTFATFGTFFVIAGTAIAAIVQLRHARGSNQIAALAELRDAFQSREYSEGRNFLETRLHQLLQDSAFRCQLANRAARTGEFQDDIDRARFVGNYFEDMGALLRGGLIDTDLTCMIYSSDLTRSWELLEPYLAIVRRDRGPEVWENFEYAVMLCELWKKRYPHGSYPPGAPRLPVRDEWLAADAQYASPQTA